MLGGEQSNYYEKTTNLMQNVSYESKSVFCCLLMQRYNNPTAHAKTFSERPIFHCETKK